MRQRRAVASALLAVFVAGCAAPRPSTLPPVITPDEPESGAPVYPREAAESSGPAVVALLAQAERELGAGAGDRAIAKLENALRIESRNPFVWQRLAEANLLERRYAQAESFARKSMSLARGNPWLALQNWRVIAAARRELGNEAGADKAEEKVAELEEQLAE